MGERVSEENGPRDAAVPVASRCRGSRERRRLAQCQLLARQRYRGHVLPLTRFPSLAGFVQPLAFTLALCLMTRRQRENVSSHSREAPALNHRLLRLPSYLRASVRRAAHVATLEHVHEPRISSFASQRHELAQRMRTRIQLL